MTDTASQQSAASAAANSRGLKYADPRSLPSFPSAGLRPDGAAASAAASLGWSNQKPIETWRPNKTSSASAAAVLAKDYKMSSAWEPTSDSAGQKAAVLAVGSAGAALKHSSQGASSQSSHGKKASQDTWGNSAADAALKQSSQATSRSSPRGGNVSQETWGNSAATQAFQANRASQANRPASAQHVKSNHGSSAATQAFNVNRSRSAKATPSPAKAQQPDRSLVAAKGAMSQQHRPRAISTPTAPESRSSHALEIGAASSALSGAALAHRASMQPKPSIENTGAVPVTTMTRNMFTSHPMVKPEVDEQQSNERLHDSAVAMAKKMYAQQQKMLDQSKESHADGADSSQGPTYLNLQDAAYKQAQDRLSKLHNEHQESREYQEYYGKAQPPRRRFSVANKLHRRSSSEGEMTDRARSDKIRQEMSMFSHQLSEVDKNKREKDREALLAAAQRNVKARLQGMDDKAYNETGKVNPNKLNEWEVKAREAAQLRHDTRNENRGKTDLGAGFYMDPDEIDAIAAKRVQPVLDDINEKAEAERERQAAIRLEQETKRGEQEREKTRDRERRELTKQLKEEEKQEEKTRRQQEKEDERARREEEKAAKAEQKRQAKEEKRKSKTGGGGGATAGAPASAASDAGEEHEAVCATATEGMQDEASTHDAHTRDDAAVMSPAAVDSTTEPYQRKPSDSPTSPSSKVKGWIKNRFSRGKSVGEHTEKEQKEKKHRSFLGGAALRHSTTQESNASAERPSSMRDVALAGKDTDGEEVAREREAGEPARDSHGVSPVTSDSDEEEGDERQHRAAAMTPPRPIEDPVARLSSSPNRDSRFREMMES